jgi:hypothetical protein
LTKTTQHSSEPAGGGDPAAAAGTPAAGTPAAGTPAAGTPAAGTPAAGTPAAGDQHKMRRKVITWILFGVIGSIVPLVFLYVARSDASLEGGIPAVLSTGELLIVSIVSTTAAVGDLLVSRKKELSDIAMINSFVAIIALLVGSSKYAAIQLAEIQKTPLPHHVFAWSISLFIVSLYIGLTTVVMSVRAG